MGFGTVVSKEVQKVLLPSALVAFLCPSLLRLLAAATYLKNYPINVKLDQLRMLPLTMGFDVHFLLKKTGYYWEHLLIFLAVVYLLITLSELAIDGRLKHNVDFRTMGHRMFVCAILPPLAMILVRRAYFMYEDYYNESSPLIRRLLPLVWHNVGIVAKMRLGMHALALFKRLERGSLENEVLLLLVTPIVSSMIMPFLTFASSLLAPLNIEKLELDQWLYSDEKKGFNEQLVVVLFEWHDLTAINGYFDLNWLCFFGFLASLLWLCSSKETIRAANDGSFSDVFNKNMLKLLCLTAPFIMKAVLPKYHYILWWDNFVDRAGYTFWCSQIYLHLFTLIARVRLLQHIFTSFRPQQVRE